VTAAPCDGVEKEFTYLLFGRKRCLFNFFVCPRSSSHFCSAKSDTTCFGLDVYNPPVSQFFSIHPDNPQARLIAQAAQIVRAGGVVVYPTDTAYALGCHIGDKAALERIRRIRRLDDKHQFSLVCKDLSELGTYARVNNSVFRQLKAHTPGPFTFILEATKEVPRRFHVDKRKQIGLRVPDNEILQALLTELGEPMVTATLILPGDELPLTDPHDMRADLEHLVDLIIDGGFVGMQESTVIDLTDDVPRLIRAGAGEFDDFLAS
jgi:tRNA threonylcarbamoyl adenosine modification protein (Sua5/YciO/YrdC/YwlC family)